MKWYLYIVECVDHSLYTGISNNLEKRVADHNLGKGAKYTRGRLPVILRYFEEFLEKGDALKREWEIKKLPREKKEKLFS